MKPSLRVPAPILAAFLLPAPARAEVPASATITTTQPGNALHPAALPVGQTLIIPILAPLSASDGFEWTSYAIPKATETANRSFLKLKVDAE